MGAAVSTERPSDGGQSQKWESLFRPAEINALKATFCSLAGGSGVTEAAYAALEVGDVPSPCYLSGSLPCYVLSPNPKSANLFREKVTDLNCRVTTNSAMIA